VILNVVRVDYQRALVKGSFWRGCHQIVKDATAGSWSFAAAATP
jgi:hypothetical protein